MVLGIINFILKRVISLYTIFGPPPPPINFLHDHIQHMDKVGHVAAAPGPLACPSRGDRPPSLC